MTDSPPPHCSALCLNSRQSAILKPLPILSLGCLFVTMVPAVAIVVEREAKCKHQLLLMGLDVRAYWTAMTLSHSLPVALFVFAFTTYLACRSRAPSAPLRP